jgi:hypothetical protein
MFIFTRQVAALIRGELMANILVIGSLDLSDQKNQDFISYLGEELADKGHCLLNGCRNALDRMVASTVFDRLKAKNIDPFKRITCYISPNAAPAHEFGTILKSRVVNWESLAGTGLHVPETIQQADAVLLIGGSEGTKCAANWARIERKPLLPITAFGGAAVEIYDEELTVFEENYSAHIDRPDYEILNQVSSDYKKIAVDAVSLAARMVISNHVFVIMSFSEDSKLMDAYESFQTVCKEYHYECMRIDDTNAEDRIIPEIFSRIKKSAFVIADLTEAKPNVYFELGFAQGLKMRVIITAYKGTTLPFDVADMPTIFWEGQKQLKERLREKLEDIASRQGRRTGGLAPSQNR